MELIMMIVFALSSARKVNQQDKQKNTKKMRGLTNHNDNHEKIQRQETIIIISRHYPQRIGYQM